VENRDIAALVGNGLSIAFNPELSIPRVNDAIVARINAESPDGTVPAAIMQRAAANIESGDPRTNFEALFGPLDQYRDGLRMFSELSNLAGDDNLLIKNALTVSKDFVESLRRFGVSHALEVIASRSTARDELVGKVHDFINSVVSGSGTGRVTFGNLNYDSLVMASLVRLFQPKFCDMTDGRTGKRFEVVRGAPSVGAHPLRTEQDFPHRAITLLHLHGSLGWLREPGPTGGVYRFNMEDLRALGYWKAWRDGRSAWTPEVVLTNQATKNSVVQNYPFSLAYEAFYERLVRADRWLIAGYSFGDGCVNDLLARAWMQRTRVPSVAVIARSAAPTDDVILESIGWDASFGDPHPATWLYAYRGGIESAPTSPMWSRWLSQEPGYKVKAS
jgi:hypothetical protein